CAFGSPGQLSRIRPAVPRRAGLPSGPLLRWVDLAPQVGGAGPGRSRPADGADGGAGRAGRLTRAAAFASTAAFRGWQARTAWHARRGATFRGGWSWTSPPAGPLPPWSARFAGPSTPGRPGMPERSTR